MSNEVYINGILYNWWGGACGSDIVSAIVTNASNIVTGGNPVYYPTDFFGFYPKFAGPTTTPNGTLTNGSPTVTTLSAMDGIVLGLYVAAPGIPDGTTIIGMDAVAKTITLSQNATANGIQQLTIYANSLVPILVLSTYIALAQSCLSFNRYGSQWLFCMHLFIAHYVTLYLRTEAEMTQTMGNFGEGGFGEGGFGGGTNLAQVAASGLARGVMVAKSVGDVSVQNDLILDGWEDWGAWNETSYGKQLITQAKLIGFGPMYIW